MTLSSISTAVLVAAGLSSCQSTIVSLDYLPNPSRGKPGPAVCAVGDFVDKRGAEPAYIGTSHVPLLDKVARVPLEHLSLNVPVSEAVRKAFGDGLEARKMVSEGPKPRLAFTGEIVAFHCEQITNPFAEVELRVNLVEASSGRVLHTQTQRVERQSVFFLRSENDVVPVMRDLASRALQDAVDRALDNPEMRSVMESHLE